jgi:hypothetical protein
MVNSSDVERASSKCPSDKQSINRRALKNNVFEGCRKVKKKYLDDGKSREKEKIKVKKLIKYFN